MLGSSLNKSKPPSSAPLRESPKRPRSESSENGESSSGTPPSHKQPRLTVSPQNLKVSQPLASSDKRKTPDRRSSSATSAQGAPTSPTLSSSRASLYPHHFAPMLPPGYPMPPMVPHAGPCTNPLCTDMTCPTGAARASFLMGVPPPSLNLLNLMHPPVTSAAAPPHPGYVCSWVSNNEVFCGKRFNSSEELMSHLRTHTVSASAASTTPTSSSLAALQAQAAMMSSVVSTAAATTSALAALQAQAMKSAQPITNTVTSSADLAAALAARYGLRPGMHAPMGLAPPAIPTIPPHLASLYGLGNPYAGVPSMLYPMP